MYVESEWFQQDSTTRDFANEITELLKQKSNDRVSCGVNYQFM